MPHSVGAYKIAYKNSSFPARPGSQRKVWGLPIAPQGPKFRYFRSCKAIRLLENSRSCIILYVLKSLQKFLFSRAPWISKKGEGVSSSKIPLFQRALDLKERWGASLFSLKKDLSLFASLIYPEVTLVYRNPTTNYAKLNISRAPG